MLLDATHTDANRGGEAVVYQESKKCKTSIMITLSDSNAIPIACSEPISANHNEAFNPTKNFEDIIESFKKSNCQVNGHFLNAGTGFDTANFGIVFSNRIFLQY
ncbi:MAG: hypothetical protein N4A49_09570 [Marinifilaceae bacterium]|nr:hypothetical protein [Marinifilaceae bacterium]